MTTPLTEQQRNSITKALDSAKQEIQKARSMPVARLELSTEMGTDVIGWALPDDGRPFDTEAAEKILNKHLAGIVRLFGATVTADRKDPRNYLRFWFIEGDTGNTDASCEVTKQVIAATSADSGAAKTEQKRTQMPWWKRIFRGSGDGGLQAGDLALDLGDGIRMHFQKIEALHGWVGKYEVRNREYRQFKPTHDSGTYEGQSVNGQDQPACRVSFFDVKAFCKWLAQSCKSQIPESYNARLPNNDEWTIFAQCGDGRPYPWGKDLPPKYGNYADRAATRAFPSWTPVPGYNDGFAVSSPVSKSGKNDWGLFGVGGNVWEWTLDEDCSQTPSLLYSCLRGGSWADRGDNLLCNKRFSTRPEARRPDAGFRVVLLHGNGLICSLPPVGDAAKDSEHEA